MVGAVYLPPPQYAHPFTGDLEVEVIPWEDVARRCGLPGVNACARTFIKFSPDGKAELACHIIYPRLSDVGPEVFVRLICHETAHCNGWPADHPDATFDEDARANGQLQGFTQ